MVERSLYSPLINGAICDGWLLYRIADGSPGKKPFDIAGFSHEIIPVGLEVKLVSSYEIFDPFPWKLFSQHQINWLRAYSEKGALGIIALYEAKKRKMTVFQPRPNQFKEGVKIAEIQKYVLSSYEQKYRDWRAISGK